MEYLIFCIPMALLLSVTLWFVIGDIVNDRKKSRRYQEYINSIRVGDIFEPNFVMDSDDDPFNEEFNYSKYSKVIIDIKKNKKGETWVKYKYLMLDSGVESTEEIHRFVEDNKRVKQSEI